VRVKVSCPRTQHNVPHRAGTWTAQSTLTTVPPVIQVLYSMYIKYIIQLKTILHKKKQQQQDNDVKAKMNNFMASN